MTDQEGVVSNCDAAVILHPGIRRSTRQAVATISRENPLGRNAPFGNADLICAAPQPPQKAETPARADCSGSAVSSAVPQLCARRHDDKRKVIRIGRSARNALAVPASMTSNPPALKQRRSRTSNAR